jgi:hypothetical protein
MRVRRVRKDRDTGRNQRHRCAGALVATLCVLLLTTGCTERDALPTGPTIGGDADPWRLIHQSIAWRSLNAAWGLDADDMWAVGSQGLILHNDGRSTRIMPRGNWYNNLLAIDGAARDAIWAVSTGGEILHWDGRTWQRVWNNDGWLYTVCALAPDDVYVGGENISLWPRIPRILHHDGRRWVDMDFAEDTVAYDSIRKIWRPGTGWPLLASSASGLLYRLATGVWTQIGELQLRAVDGDLVLARDPEDTTGMVSSLYELQPDGSLEHVCGGPDLALARLLVSSRHTVVGYPHRIARLDDCVLTPLWDTDVELRDLARPILAGEQGRHLFAVGRAGPDGAFYRLTWRDDLTLDATSLLAPIQQHAPQQVVSNETGLFFSDTVGNVWHGQGGSWQRLDTPFAVNLLHVLADGSLVVASRYQIAVLEPDGTWTQLPPSPHAFLSWWIDEHRRPRTIIRDPATQHMELWALDEAGWQRLATLSEQPVWISGPAGGAPDDLFLAVSGVLLHHDGEDLQGVAATNALTISDLHAGDHTGRLYFRGWDEDDHWVYGYLHAGHLTVLPESHAWVQLQEVTADLILCRTYPYTSLYRWTEAGLIPVPGPGSPTVLSFWGHLDHGLVVITSDGAIHQRSLPELRP